MKILITICATIFAFNAMAYSFTEQMSLKHKTGVKSQVEQQSSLTEEDKTLCEGRADHADLVKWLLVVISVLLSITYIQHRKIQSLLSDDE